MRKRVILPISEQDYAATGKRFFYLIKSLSDYFIVELLTVSKDVYEDINKRLGESKNIFVKIIESKELPLPLDLRTDLSKIFVRYTYDLVIPGTELKLWKTAAFDDFWGHIAMYSFNELSEINADIVLLPLPSIDSVPAEDIDVFYTSILFRAKESGIKVAGYQLYPVFQVLKLAPLLMDALIVKEEYERQFYIDMGVRPEAIFTIKDERDRYSISTIEDTYKNHIYNDQISISRDELGIVVFNHPKMRPQIGEIFSSVREAKIPVVIFLLRFGYNVKDLSENEIIRDFYLDNIKKIANSRYFLVEMQSAVPTIMISDVVIAPTYAAPVEFGARYGKKSFVYNPFYLYDKIRDFDLGGAIFVNNIQDLSSLLRKAHKEKQSKVAMADIVSSILRSQNEA